MVDIVSSFLVIVGGGDDSEEAAAEEVGEDGGEVTVVTVTVGRVLVGMPFLVIACLSDCFFKMIAR